MVAAAVPVGRRRAAAVRAEARVVPAVREAAAVAEFALARLLPVVALAARRRRDGLALGVLVLALVAVAARPLVAERAADLTAKK